MMHNVSKSDDGKIWSTFIKYQQEVTFKNKKKNMYAWQIQTFDKQSVFLEWSIKLITFCQKYKSRSEQHFVMYVNNKVEWKK